MSTERSKEKKELLKQIKLIKDYYFLTGEVFKGNAYQKVYDSLNNLSTSIPTDIKKLKEIKGVGKKIAERIIEFQQTGKIKEYDKFLSDFDAYKEIGSIWGVGPRKTKELINAGFRSINDINNNLSLAKLNKQQLIGLKYHDDIKKRIPRKEILLFKKKFNKKIISSGLHFDILGSFKRQKETSGDIDILLWHDEDKTSGVINSIYEKMKENFDMKGLLTKGEKKMSGLFVIDKYPRHIDFLIVPLDDLPTSIQYFTGSGPFNVALRNHAISKGYKLSDKGLFDNSGKKLKLKDEKDIFDILGLKFIKPKDRDILFPT